MKKFFRKLSRAFSYFKIGFNSVDYDYSDLYKLIKFKLDRYLDFFINRGWHDTECPMYRIKIKSLKLSIKLLNKIINFDYDRYSSKHDEKWGKSEIDTIPYGEFFQLKFSRKNAISQEDQDQERIENNIAYDKDDQERQRDLDKLFNIIRKYHICWWD
jgi:hypothetical protein